MSSTAKSPALRYHAEPKPGKTGTAITKSTETQEDLSLAYSPGVAEPVIAISEDPETAYEYTNRGNLIGVITNGSAVLGLGNRGPLASKPVMEGKVVLFKKFADIDAFDLEIDASTPDTFISTVAALAPTFGGINLEDIKAPECFQIEGALKERLDIPVFHDDQHGTAIIIAAALLNALSLQEKKIEEVTIVCLGAGAAGVASLRLLMKLGAKRDNMYMLDRQGVIHPERSGVNAYKLAFANRTKKRTLEEVIDGADVFIGVSGANLLKEEHVATMAPNPVIFALSNPDPEISPEAAKRVRPDCIMATGRSDYPNQVNNVLCFPFIFRGALDAKATTINSEMCIAATHAIADLAKLPVPEEVRETYASEGDINFGPEYIIPKPFDPRIRDAVVPAVIEAAQQSGVVRR